MFLLEFLYRLGEGLVVSCQRRSGRAVRAIAARAILGADLRRRRDRRLAGFGFAAAQIGELGFQREIVRGLRLIARERCRYVLGVTMAERTSVGVGALVSYRMSLLMRDQ